MGRLGIKGSILTIAFLIAISGLYAQTQGDLDEQACGQFHKADVATNEVYSRILKEYAKDEEFIAKLKAAQKTWTAFRDAQLEALFPKANTLAEYGTVYPMCHCIELQSLTEERTKQLKMWVDGIPEGDVCTGSIKVTQSPRPLTGSREGAQHACLRAPQASSTDDLTRTH